MTNKLNRTLIVFARQPEIGKVKTRLAKKIGNEVALTVYQELLNTTLSVVKSSGHSYKVYWASSPNSNKGEIQKGVDLGEKMFNAIHNELNNADKVCLIGTDIPNISKEIIDMAFDALSTSDIVFGPAKDGGYYLIGMKKHPVPELLINKRWSHSKVLEEALDTCLKNNLSTYLLPILSDIDTLEDLNEWKKDQTN